MKKLLMKLLRPLVLEILKEGNKTDINIKGNLFVDGSVKFSVAKQTDAKQTDASI